MVTCFKVGQLRFAELVAETAEAIVSVVGIKNAYAAYFLGKTELIGKK